MYCHYCVSHVLLLLSLLEGLFLLPPFRERFFPQEFAVTLSMLFVCYV